MSLTCRLFGHQHIRERDKAGILWLACDRCDHRVEAISRTASERKAMRTQFPSVIERKVQSLTSGSTVVQMGKRRKR